MTACQDWAQRLKEGRSIIPPPLYPESAEQALRIFKRLRITDIAGKPTFGEVSAQWVFDFVAAVFGGYNPETGEQAVKEVLLMLAKKATKSTISAGLMLTALLLSWREDEEHLILAPTLEVASNSFKPAASMVRADPELSDRLHVRDHLRTIECRVTRNSLKVVAADSATVGGKKAGRILVDELWLFGDKPGAEAMLMEATGGQVSRPEGFTIYLTTQADKAPAGVFKERLGYFRKVRDGEIEDPHALPIIYEYPQEMVDAKDYLDPATWHIPNPNLGRSVSKDWLERELQKAQQKDDGSLQQFLAKHLNIEIGLRLASNRWPGADLWEPRADKTITLPTLLERSEVVTVGIDGGGLDDLLGLAVLGREKDTGQWLLWCHAWLHPIALERRKSEAARYHDFRRDGDLDIIEALPDDVTAVADVVAQVHEAGLLAHIGVDPEKTHKVILQALLAADIPQELIIGISQGWKMVGAITLVERKLADGSLSHAGQPLMAWCVGNAKVEPRGNAIAITKQASGTAKIDPLAATFNAASLMALNPEAMSGRYEMFFLG